MENRRAAGSRWEEQAADYLVGKGYRILERNFRSKTGEIDIVARHKDILVFVEVKARRNANYGRPCEAVTPQKLRTISRTAEFYMCRFKCHDASARIDVLEIIETEGSLVFSHIENVTG